MLLCSTLLLLQTFGVHVHAVPDHHPAQEHVHASIDDAYEHEHHTVVSGHAAHHAAAHLEGGAADIEQARVFGKGSMGLVLFALLGTALLLALLPALRSIAMPVLSPVPIRRRGGYLIPPSQAPPLAS